MTTDAAPRSPAGIAFLVAGGAVLISIVIFAAGVAIDTRFVYVLGFLAMSAAFILLGRSGLTNGTARTASYFVALGWFLLAVVGGVPGLSGVVGSIAYVLLFAASVVLGAVVLARGELSPVVRRSVVFLLAATTVYAACSFLISHFGGPFAALLTIVIGAAAVISGYLIQNRR